MINLQFYYEKLPQNFHETLTKRVQKKVLILEKFLVNYPHKVLFHITPWQNKNTLFTVEIILQLKTKKIVVKKTARSVLQAFEIAFTSLKTNMIKTLEENKDRNYSEAKRQSSQLLNDYFQTISEQPEPIEYSSFSTDLLPLLSNVDKYIKRQLFFIYIKRPNEPESILGEDIIQDVTVKAFDTFHDIPSNLTIEQWLYQLAFAILNKTLKKNKREEITKINHSNKSNSASFYYETEDFIPTKIAKEYTRLIPSSLDRNSILTIDRTIQLLRLSSIKNRSIYDLYFLEGFSVKEIAVIHTLKVHEIQTILDKMQNQI